MNKKNAIKMHKKFFLFLTSFLLIGFNLVYAEGFNYPYLEIDSFSTKEFKGSNQTWGITQNSDGRMYFANQGGILIYDGKTWKTVFAEKDAPARSISFSPDGRLLIGTMGDVGKLISNIEGKPYYVSLLSEEQNNKISDSQVVYEVIPLSEQEILLRTKNSLYIHSDNELKTIKNPQKYKFGVAKYIDNEIYVYCIGHGICRVNGESLKIIEGTQSFNNSGLGINYFEKISAEEMLLVTRREGIFILNNGDLRKIDISNNLLNSTNIYRGIRLRNGNLALATYDGIFILDNSINPIIHIDRNSGLLADNVRSLFEDGDGNLWAGLNNGISKIKISSPIKSYPQKFAGINSKTRDMAIFNDTVFIATDIGIKKLTINYDILREQFDNVIPDDLKTQVWGLVPLDGSLFIASNFGLGKFIDGKYINEIDFKITGRVYNIEISKYLPKTLFLATAKGLFIYEPDSNNILSVKLDKGKVWVLKEDVLNGSLWTKIIGEGVYKIDLSNYYKNSKNITVKKYTHEDGLPDNTYRSLVFNYINDKILLGTKYGTFYLDEDKNKFINFGGDENNTEFFNSFIKYSEQLGDVAWLGIEDKSELGRNVSFFSLDNNFQVNPLPLTSLGNEFNLKFYPIGNQVVITSSAGLSVVEKNLVTVNPLGKTFINEALVNNRSFLNAGTLKVFHGGDVDLPDEFSYDQNKFNFSIAATDYSNENEILFRYKLIGVDDFSNWAKNNYVTYTNLLPGLYKLVVESKNYFGQQLQPYEYEFTITPPWWQSKIFYLSEILFFLILLSVTLFLKKSGKATIIATSISFMMILALFEYINFLVDPLILLYSNGVPVFTIFSKIILGVILLPLERLMNKMLDYVSNSNFFQKLTSIKK